MLDDIQQLFKEDRFFKIAVYVFILGTFSALYMFATTYFHYMFGTKLPDSSEFLMELPEKK